MISLRQIERLMECRAYTRLTRRILTNGRWAGPIVAQRLTEPANLAPAALGLALQRAGELTYAHEPVIDRLVSRLLRLRRADGLLGTPDDASPAGRAVAGTAVAVRALADLAGRYEQSNLHGLPRSIAVRKAVTQAIEATARLQDDAGGIGRDAVDSAIVLWQLAPLAKFRTAARFDDLADHVGRSEGVPSLHQLCRMAHALAA